MARLGEVLCGLLVLALVCIDLCQEQLVVCPPQPALQLNLVKQLNVSHVPNPDEGLASNLEVQATEGLDGKNAPIIFSGAQACNLVGVKVVLLFQVPVDTDGLRDVNGVHSHEVEAENLGPFEPHNEALQLLLMDRKVACLDVEYSIPTEAEHILVFGIPGDAVGVQLLEDQLLVLQMVHQAICVLIYHCQLHTAGTQIQTPHRGIELDQLDGEGVVDEDLQNGAVLQSHKQGLPLNRPANHFDVSDHTLQHPFPLLAAAEVVQLQLLLLAQHNVH
mmetsp:Transcript_78083/g.137783  ORF Transcript_78083/g.137783 Transcript_78083/m.137783 type:complete len:276 (-) Transcript_78083:1278-2105(-)